jgi:uncharacterized membrane protein
VIKKLNQIFFKGLILILPISLTFYLLFWISVKVESLFGSIILWAVGQEFYFPGTGIILTILVIFLVGLMAHSYVTGPIFRWFTGQMEKFPLIKAIYNPLKDLMALIPGRGQETAGNQRVVLVPYAGVQVLGMVTREKLDELNRPDLISVYVPFGYMLGGMTLLVPRDQVQKVDMPVDQALKLSVTAWIKAREEK